MVVFCRYGLARFSWEFEQKRMGKTGQPPLQADLVHPSAGEADFLVRLIAEMCLAGNFIGLRAKNAELVITGTMRGRSGCAANHIMALSVLGNRRICQINIAEAG